MFKINCNLKLTIFQGAIGKAKDCMKLQDDKKMQESMVQNVVQRAGVISFGTLAEIDYFQTSRCAEFKQTMTTFLNGQINFYQEVSNDECCFRAALSRSMLLQIFF